MTDTPPQPGGAPVVWENPERIDGPAPGMEYAPYGGRLAAYIIDILILGIACSITSFAAVFLLAAGATVDGQTVTNIDAGASAGFLLLLLVTIVIGFGYFPYFWSHGGQTPGMRPFHLRVVNDHDGSPFGWGTALLRLIGLWVAALVFYIGYIWVFIDKRRRGWQDLIAGTIVIRQP